MVISTHRTPVDLVGKALKNADGGPAPQGIGP